MNINEWQTAYLGDIAEVIDPHPSHRAPAEAKEGIPFAGIGDFYEDGSINFSSCRCVDIKIFKDHNARYEIKRGDIGFGRVASIGKVIQLREDLLPYAVSPTLAVIKPKGINPYYLIQFLKSFQLQEQIGSLLTGTTRSSLGIELLRNLIIVFPHSKEQTKITEVLSTVDKAISETEAAIAKQQRIKTGLMQDLLTRGIDENGNLRSEETHQFKDSPLGRIPIEWEFGKLESLAEAIDPQPDHRTPEAVSDGFPYIGISDINEDGSINFDNARKISKSAFEKQKKAFSISKGDFIFGKIGTIGQPTRIPEKQGFALSANIILIKPLESPDFVYWWMNSPIAKRLIDSELHTTSQPAFGIKKIREFIVLKPSLEERNRIGIILENFNNSIMKNRKNLIKLQSLKTGLMQDLLTGKKRVTPLLEDCPIS